MIEKSILVDHPSISYIIINKKPYLSGYNMQSMVFCSFFNTAKEQQIMAMKLPNLHRFILPLSVLAVRLL